MKRTCVIPSECSVVEKKKKLSRTAEKAVTTRSRTRWRGNARMKRWEESGPSMLFFLFKQVSQCFSRQWPVIYADFRTTNRSRASQRRPIPSKSRIRSFGGQRFIPGIKILNSFLLYSFRDLRSFPSRSRVTIIDSPRVYLNSRRIFRSVT